jgi:hypothetical protein
MNPRFPSDDLRRAIRLATLGACIRIGTYFVPFFPSTAGYRPQIDFARSPLNWGGGVMVAVAIIVLTIVARSRMRQDAPGRSVAGGILLTIGVLLAVSAIANFMALFEVVRVAGDFLDIGSGRAWFGLALGLLAAALFLRAGALALRAEPVEERPTQPMPPAPPLP